MSSSLSEDSSGSGFAEPWVALWRCWLARARARSAELWRRKAEAPRFMNMPAAGCKRTDKAAADAKLALQGPKVTFEARNVSLFVAYSELELGIELNQF